MTHNVINPNMFGGRGNIPPPEINPRVFCNENSKGKIYDEKTSKDVFLNPTPPIPPHPPTLTLSSMWSARLLFHGGGSKCPQLDRAL